MTEFRRAGRAPSVDPPTLQIPWARLPVLWWRDVPLIQLDPVELNELDVFMVDAVGWLGRLDAGTFTELTGLPGLVFAALGRRLHTLELLAWEGDALVALPGGAENVGGATLARRSETALDFLYLPETDDLLVIEGGLATFEEAIPRKLSAAPVPTALHHMTIGELLSRRIRERRIAGLPSSVVELGSYERSDELITAMARAGSAPLPVCPAVEGSATLELEGEQPRLTLQLKHRRRRDGRGTNSGASDTATLDISGATGLVSAWIEVAERVVEPKHRADAVGVLAPVPLTPALLRAEGPVQWSLGVTKPQAESLAEQASLVEPVGLEIRDPHARVVTGGRFTPADEGAERLFVQDALIQRLLARPKAVVETVLAERDAVDSVGGPRSLRERAWRLGHRWVVHALREPDDFDYV